ncbi:hypothetical protein RJ639_014998, partial [Escallonia herrerae]
MANADEFIHTAIAIDRDKNSQHAVKWAVENRLKKNSLALLIHVRTTGSQSQEDLPVHDSREGRAPTESELQQLFLPYRGFCARKGVRTKEVVLQDIDVVTALAAYVADHNIGSIVLGASSRNALSSFSVSHRAFRNTADVPTSLGKSVPDFCSVYAVAKGKPAQTIKSAIRPPTPRSAASSRRPSQTGFSSDSLVSEDFNRSFSQESWKIGSSDSVSFDRNSETMSFDRSSERLSSDKSSDFMVMTPHAGLPRIPSPQNLVNNLNLRVITPSPHYPHSMSDASDFSGPPSFQSSDMSYENLDYSRASDGSRSSVSSQTQQDIEEEMRRLRKELKQTMEMYNSACKETTNAKQKAKEIDLWKSTEARRLEEAKQAEEAALAMVEMEKQKSKAAMEAAQMAQRLAELEFQKRRNAEIRAKREAEGKKKAMDALARSDIRYRKYAIEDIEIATNHFSDSAKIGEGGYGPVYKAILDHTAVAIKVLRPDISQGQKQFQNEIEVLSCMRHPHMVLLVGACPEYGCLVYEYMENGSLEDRLFRRNNTPTIPWRLRFKIAAEIATALLFLHQSKPEPLVHRDLKPANILLDQNYVSKIADVGLARLIPPSVADSVTQYHMTAAAGTFCYIDPEYQQTGMLGTKSDVYSLGVMLLQLITAKPAMGLTHQVSKAIDRGKLAEVLDPTVTDWPVDEVLSFAKLSLQCCELRRKDRPDLGSVILPELNRLRNLELPTGASQRDNETSYGVSPYKTMSEMRSSMRE